MGEEGKEGGREERREGMGGGGTEIRVKDHLPPKPDDLGVISQDPTVEGETHSPNTLTLLKLNRTSGLSASGCMGNIPQPCIREPLREPFVFDAQSPHLG